jgi:beta-alanine--pyruvate transaminase
LASCGTPGARGYECLVNCFEQGLLIRTTGDIIALSPPLTIEPNHIDQLIEQLTNVLKTLP